MAGSIKKRLSSIGKGLTGIGSAIEYLAQNGYFEVDTDRVLNRLGVQNIHESTARIVATNCVPYFSSFASPTPLTLAKASIVKGFL